MSSCYRKLLDTLYPAQTTPSERHQLPVVYWQPGRTPWVPVLHRQAAVYMLLRSQWQHSAVPVIASQPWATETLPSTGGDIPSLHQASNQTHAHEKFAFLVLKQLSHKKQIVFRLNSITGTLIFNVINHVEPLRLLAAAWHWEETKLTVSNCESSSAWTR